MGVIDLRGVMVSRTEPVLDDERSDPLLVEPLGDLCAFMIHCQRSVTATREDENAGAVCLGGIRGIDGDRGLIDRFRA